MMRFIGSEVNFEVTCEGQQNWLKTYFKDISQVFDDHHVTSKFTSLHVNLIMSSYFLWTSSTVKVFDREWWEWGQAELSIKG